METPPPTPEQIEKDNNTLDTEPLALTLDLEIYLDQLTDWDISEEQKTEFIIAWWELLVSFAQIGFRIHPAQQATQSGRKTSEKSAKTQENAPLCADNMLYSKPVYRTRIIQNSSALNAGDGADSTNETRPS